jgi:hypothetical protein
MNDEEGKKRLSDENLRLFSRHRDALIEHHKKHDLLDHFDFDVNYLYYFYQMLED